MVSIIPGIEAGAPERTDTKSGFSVLTKFHIHQGFNLLDIGSTSGRSASISFSRPSL